MQELLKDSMANVIFENAYDFIIQSSKCDVQLLRYSIND
jgi:hypothetical protein